MSTCYAHENAGPSGANGPQWGPPGAWAMRHSGPPLPVKILAVGVGFLIFKPLGLGLAAYFLLKGVYHHGPWNARFADWRGARPTVANSAFAERRRETLKRLHEEETAFADFAQKQREAKDKEAFDRFMADRAASDGQAPKE